MYPEKNAEKGSKGCNEDGFDERPSVRHQVWSLVAPDVPPS